MASRQRRGTVLAVGVVATLSLAACSSGSGGGGGSTTGGSGTPTATSSGVVHITLSHGYTDVESKAITAQVASWNSSHPGIQVKLVFNGGNDGALQ